MANIDHTDVPATDSVNVSDTSNTTFDIVEAVVDTKIRIHQLLISSESAEAVTLKSGDTTLMGPIYLGGPGGLILDLYRFRLISGRNEAITLTKATSANNKVTVTAVYSLGVV